MRVSNANDGRSKRIASKLAGYTEGSEHEEDKADIAALMGPNWGFRLQL